MGIEAVIVRVVAWIAITETIILAINNADHLSLDYNQTYLDSKRFHSVVVALDDRFAAAVHSMKNWLYSGD